MTHIEYFNEITMTRDRMIVTAKGWYLTEWARHPERKGTAIEVRCTPLPLTWQLA